MKLSLSRRKFLQTGTGLVAASILTQSLTAQSQTQTKTCRLTPPQTSGPFYPGQALFHPDHDLTKIPGSSISALGTVIYVRGKILDENCQPVAGANVEIWQACASGRYNSPKDTNPAIIDPNFKYWGEIDTDPQGQYWFKTIIPGAYPANNNWTRPPHIHFKVSKLGYRELVTQMYFEGEVLNDSDLILQDLSPEERAKVIVTFNPTFNEFPTLNGNFDITISSIQPKK